MAGDPEFPTIPSGEPIVDVLIDAYNGKRWPNEFQERPGLPHDPPTEEASLIRDRVGAIPFSPYWGKTFQELRGYTGNPLGFFAVKLFDVAREQEGPDFMRATAMELGNSFGELVLDGELDIPGLAEVPIDVPRLSSAATFLVEKRSVVGEHRLHADDLKPISDSWIRLLHSLVVQDTEQHDRTLADLTASFVQACDEVRANAGEFMSMGGELSPFDHLDALNGAIARPLGSHFPELVVSHLADPAIGDVHRNEITTGKALLPRTVN
ncbi:MAG TPA: hypothetical protein VIJ68_00055 [Candidatus Saccharimonadales bacterium]